jgi:ribonucleoside-triphosphate reductase
MIVNLKFKLKDEFIRRYSTVQPNFGFNGLGELVYLRTYSRIKEDGTNEQWFETIRRVVEGTYSIQKRHIMQYDLGWDENKAQESAQEMYDRMFKMKFLPPGYSVT